MNSKDSIMGRATALVHDAQRELGRTLTDGERRDLLADNTPWDTDLIRCIVEALAWQEQAPNVPG